MVILFPWDVVKYTDSIQPITLLKRKVIFNFHYSKPIPFYI